MAWNLVDSVVSPTAPTEQGRVRASRLVRELEGELARFDGDTVIAGRASDLATIAVGELDGIRARRGRVGICCAWLVSADDGARAAVRCSNKFFDACSPDAEGVVVFMPFLADEAILHALVDHVADCFPVARITCLVGASAFAGVESTSAGIGRQIGREVEGRVITPLSATPTSRRHARRVEEVCHDAGDDRFPVFPPIVAIELLNDALGLRAVQHRSTASIPVPATAG